MNPNRSSIYSDIQCIELFINCINNISEQYKEYYRKALIHFKNDVIFDNETQILYKDKFNKMNINLISFIKKNIFKIIKYISNLFIKYNIPKKVVLFNTFNFLYKEYIWIEKIEDLSVNYIVYDLNIILNYFLEKMIVYNNTNSNKWIGLVAFTDINRNVNEGFLLYSGISMKENIHMKISKKYKKVIFNI